VLVRLNRRRGASGRTDGEREGCRSAPAGHRRGKGWATEEDAAVVPPAACQSTAGVVDLLVGRWKEQGPTGSPCRSYLRRRGEVGGFQGGEKGGMGAGGSGPLGKRGGRE
jgi:hypothetical protein